MIYSCVDKGKIFFYLGSRGKDTEKRFDEFYSYGWQIFKMGLVSCFGLIIGLTLLYVLTDLVGIFYMISSAISWAINSMILYIANSFFTFNTKPLFRGWLRYVGVTLVTTILYFILLFVLTEYARIYYLFSSVIALVSCLLGNFLLVRKLVWR